VVVLGADVFFLTQRNVTTPVTLAKSVERFRSLHPPQPGSPTTTTAAPTAGPASTAQAPARRDAKAAVPAPTTAPRQAQASSSAAFTPPDEGVYAYATTGYEKVSMGGSRHDYPSESFATVRRSAGCKWQWEHRVVEEHVETATSCGQPGLLQFLSDTEQVTFFGQTNTRTTTCDPPEVVVQVGDPIGSRRSFVCQLEGGRVDVVVTYLGREAMSVGGIPVEAFHAIIDGTQSGDVQGSSRFEVWVHPLTGLTLRQVVHVQSRSKFLGSNVDYTEDATYTLERLTPST
jgi:hypothetical protein